MLETSKKAKLVYYLLIGASLMGSIMPVASEISKLKNKINLSERLSDHLGTYMLNDLIFWAINIFPKWHDVNVGGDHGMYSLRWSIWSFFFMMALILFNTKALNLSTSLVLYYRRQQKILVAVVFILVTFLSTFFWGFWFRGIPTWDYRNKNNNLLPLEEYVVSQDSRKGYLLSGVNGENFKKYIGPGCLVGNVIIGFYNGHKFPIHDGISGFVRPGIFHKFLQPPDVKHEEVPWVKLINHRIKNLSKENKLWKKIKYPNHYAYPPLPFDISEIDGFEKIEYWNVTACFDGNKIYISKFELLNTYD
jgi:hypothetical protein